jgi:hypothetical protein
VASGVILTNGCMAATPEQHLYEKLHIWGGVQSKHLVTQLLVKFPANCRNERFVTVFSRARRRSVSGRGKKTQKKKTQKKNKKQKKNKTKQSPTSNLLSLKAVKISSLRVSGPDILHEFLVSPMGKTWRS